MKKGMQMLRLWIKNITAIFYHILLPVMPVKKDMIVFDSSIGLNYTGNPRAIYERMVELGLDRRYHCIWFFQRGKEPLPEEWSGSAKKVRYGSLSYLYYMSVAGFWIFDSRQPKMIRKKFNQHYIQTWHGTPLKKLALDMENVSMSDEQDVESYKKEFAKNAGTWDFLIAQNDFSARIFRRCFAFQKEMLCTGYPRNDVLFHMNHPDAIRNLKERLGLPVLGQNGEADMRKVLLYAPTWRDDEYNSNGMYKFKPRLNFALLQKKLKKDYIIIVKYHYLIGDQIDWREFDGFVYPFTARAEISSLYLVADALITDYSSVMFDYGLLRRPMYFYAYDLDKYRDELRGFYFDFLAEAPGPVSQTTEDLIRDILNYGIMPSVDFEERCQAFYRKFHGYEKGNASDQIIRRIRNIYDASARE